MNGIREFFQKYHGVPGGNAGPQWEAADDDALLDWFTGECGLLRRGTGDPQRMILKGVLAEMWARVGRLSAECARRPADWPGRNTVGRLLAALATNADLFALTVK